MSIARRLCLIAVVVVFATSLASCGGGSGGVVILPTGDLIVTNDIFSFFVIDFVEVSGPDFVQLFPFIVPGDSLAVLDLVPGTYSVTIGWTDFTSDVFFPVDIFSGSPTEVIGFN